MIFILFDYGCSVTCTQVVSHLIHSPMYSPKVLLLHMNQKHYWDHLPRNYKSLNSQHRTMFTQDNKYKAEALNQTLEEQSTSRHHNVVEKIWSGVCRYSVQAAPRCPESCLSSSVVSWNQTTLRDLSCRGMTAARIRRMGGKITSNHDGGRLEREDGIGGERGPGSRGRNGSVTTPCGSWLLALSPLGWTGDI
jgi:hypothetical protein